MGLAIPQIGPADRPLLWDNGEPPCSRAAIRISVPGRDGTVTSGTQRRLPSQHDVGPHRAHVLELVEASWPTNTTMARHCTGDRPRVAVCRGVQIDACRMPTSAGTVLSGTADKRTRRRVSAGIAIPLACHLTRVDVCPPLLRPGQSHANWRCMQQDRIRDRAVPKRDHWYSSTVPG